MIDNTERRTFLTKAGLVAAACSFSGFASAVSAAEQHEENISPTEDLMREHGLLNRVLLVYDHCADQLQIKHDVDLNALAESRDIIKNFVEAYHEKVEEEHLFPRFEKAKKLTELVAILRQQHDAGRQVTAEIGNALAKKDRALLVTYLRAFTRMYRPHEAREDTVLFPAFQSLVSAKEYKELGEQNEAREHQLFGKEGFEGQVERVGKIERALGIYELSQFTPHVSKS